MHKQLTDDLEMACEALVGAHAILHREFGYCVVVFYDEFVLVSVFVAVLTELCSSKRCKVFVGLIRSRLVSSGRR